MLFCVLTADIHRSRFVTDRQSLQHKNETHLKSVNQSFANMTITLYIKTAFVTAGYLIALFGVAAKRS
ncbi:hypothetical protein BMS3Abin05_02513 [bacterium BMS3Abin05]|nr:hypothetical protein BMS3Abin05_02513 [bacterium BMS3Abin05]